MAVVYPVPQTVVEPTVNRALRSRVETRIDAWLADKTLFAERRLGISGNSSPQPDGKPRLQADGRAAVAKMAGIG